VLHIAIERITKEDLRALVVEGRREDVQLEFKLTLPSGNDEGKKEFLKDVTALANSQGGDLVYGIREDRTNTDDAGKAAELVGVSDVSADATKLWMYDLLNSSVEERLTGVVIREIGLSNDTFALVVRVPKSWNSPHVVRHRNHWRFYARHSAGVYAMNVTDLRTAFLLSDTLAQRLESFREERLTEIVKNNPGIGLNKDWSDNKPSSSSDKRESLLVVHLQPFDSVRPGQRLNVAQELRGEEGVLNLCGDPYTEANIRLNFDGVLATYRKNYIQLYRSSTTEEVDFDELGNECDGNRFDLECIGATELDRAIFKAVGRRLLLLKRLGVSGPVSVSVALINVKGCKLLLRYPVYVGGQPSHYQYRLSPHVIDRQNLLLTGLVIENLQEFSLEGHREDHLGTEFLSWRAVQPLLRPYSDTIWNAVGYPRSEYFDPEGKWVGHLYRKLPNEI
jgi:hypothetical protein